MNSLYMVKSFTGRQRRGRESLPTDRLEYALAHASELAASARIVLILKAETEGVNAHKFFLHLIVK